MKNAGLLRRKTAGKKYFCRTYMGVTQVLPHSANSNSNIYRLMNMLEVYITSPGTLMSVAGLVSRRVYRRRY